MTRTGLIALSLTALVWGSGASASSDDGWEEFRNEVRTACIAVAGLSPTTELRVDPFGTDSYGVAVAVVADNLIVCIFDKQTKSVEVSRTAL